MSKSSIQIAATLFFLTCISISDRLVAWGAHKDVYRFVCDLVEEKFYLENDSLYQWADHCRQQAEEVSFFTNPKELINQIHINLFDLRASHLDVYTPVEDKLMWKGKALDTGMRAVGVDGHIMVFKIIPQSPAEKVGVKIGDECVAINGKIPTSIAQLQQRAGVFEFLRGEKRISVEIRPEELTIDSGPNLKALGDGIGLLEISTFRSEYFDKESWQKISSEFSKYKKLIIDLRGNSGGNLVAMLRGLSPFFCENEIIGELDQPRRDNKKIRALADNLNEMVQIKHLEVYDQVPFKSFSSSYECYHGSVLVLIDHETASVAEIFAQAITQRAKSLVLGQVTAGDVLIAVWYDLPYLASGYTLSVPQALYKTNREEILEGSGVWPQKELYYLIEDFQGGEDSWIKQAKQINF